MMGSRSPYAGMIQQQRGGAPGMGPGAGIRPAPRQQQAPVKKDGGGLGAMMGGAMSSMMSDERSKKEIERLEGANEALTAALSSTSKASYPDVGAPSSGMQALGQQPSGAPSQASFPDSPAANKVAAQNVGMQGGPPPPAPMANANPAFNVQRGTPDLSALDEAYRRMGQGG